MAVTSYKSATVITEDTSVGTNVWINPGRALQTGTTTPTNFAEINWATGTRSSSYLKASGFGFTTADIPAGSTIDGIQCRCRVIEGSVTDRLFFYEWFIIKSDGTLITGSNQNVTNDLGSATWPTAQTTVQSTGSTNLMGYTGVTDSDVTDPDFGFAIRVATGTPPSTLTSGTTPAGFLNLMQIRIYYTPPAGSVASASGTGAATGVGASQAAAVASSAGVGAATGVGSSQAASVASSAGVGAATGVGRSNAAAVASSAGVGTATGIAASTAASIGSAAGVGAAVGVSSVISQAVGNAAGVGTATGVAATTGSVASAGGTSAVSGVGASQVAAVANAAGAGAATGISSVISQGVGNAAGTSTVQATGATTGSTGNAAGSSTADGISSVIAQATGSAAGGSTASAVGTSQGGVVTPPAENYSGYRVKWRDGEGPAKDDWLERERDRKRKMVEIVRSAVDPKPAEIKAAAVPIAPVIVDTAVQEESDDYALEMLLLLAA